jgi:hypothetical protein
MINPRFRLMRVSLTIFVLLLLTPGCPARLSTIPNIADLTEKSRLIVVGEVIRVDTVGKDSLPYNGAEFPALSRRAELRVDATLKGAATSGTIRIVYPENETFEDGPLTNALIVGAYSMLFLIERDEGYGFAESAQSTMPMSRDLAALPYPAGPDTYTRVLQYLATALFSMQATTQERLQSIFTFDLERGQAATDLFRSALAGPAASEDHELRLQLLAALVRRRDTSVLPEFTVALFAPSESKYVDAQQNMVLALQQIDGNLALPILARVLHESPPGVRANAAMALKLAPRDGAIDALLTGLDDPDPTTRFQVMEALSALTRQGKWVPSSPTPDASWSRCVDHWKEFATARNGSGQQP